jgi:glutamine amidotransferase
MGWNQLERRRESVLLEGVSAGAYFYFAHSYAALDNGDIGDSAVAKCDHGAPFVAVLERANVLAVQFHPEKSAEAGARVLQNFVAYAAATQAQPKSGA